MKLKLIDQRFSVCKVAEMAIIDWNAPFCFAARTDEECSLVCPEEHVPVETLAREDGWRAMRIEGVLDFSLIGILARIAGLLAEAGIPIFAVSTYNTDYVLLKEDQLDAAIKALLNSEYQIETA